ncbi:M20/M25/M40 family metallo-hydrolase [Olivibacter sp. SDN3]|uniref:M20/M25/M40 family metallo-hydrolase n=1 Tax=Olivibacter sp. SDN3 TaxID=2764720 RepID=UPI001650DC00|nr:M20/M25/M40 family metallo-hydrolase [Olivibacter sp. SDN3]QNL50899.1 M20/M25/M40 family metallo-hydrolase [Olivibacter sp. SDN3]
MKKYLYVLIGCFLLGACTAQRQYRVPLNETEVYQVIAALADDSMQGRAVFTEGIEQAADYISSAFQQAGLAESFLNTKGGGYRQTFDVIQVQPSTCEITIDGELIADKNAFVISDQAGVNWNANPEVEVITIPKGSDFKQVYREIVSKGKDVLAYVDESFAAEFASLRQYIQAGRIIPVDEEEERGSSVFVLKNNGSSSFRVNYSGTVSRQQLFNVVGMLKGKSRPDEYVIFSAHYDHLGVIEPVGKDSIANGADDDASGVTAVISLAKLFAKEHDNERSLIFAAFTAEESGGYGSQFFSKQLDPEKIVAMINMEMIGKDAKFGPNSVYLTGYEKSDLGKILQTNVEKTGFTFHPDPYPEQNLFYRSDNATLAALGVPAHTVSTVQIDKDKYYHTVHDELKTLDVKNIISSIRAVALGTRSIIAGKDTPSRIPQVQLNK